MKLLAPCPISFISSFSLQYLVFPNLSTGWVWHCSTLVVKQGQVTLVLKFSILVLIFNCFVSICILDKLSYKTNSINIYMCSPDCYREERTYSYIKLLGQPIAFISIYYVFFYQPNSHLSFLHSFLSNLKDFLFIFFFFSQVFYQQIT